MRSDALSQKLPQTVAKTPLIPPSGPFVQQCQMSKSKLKEGTQVWVQDTGIAGADLFTMGTILSISGDKATVQIQRWRLQ